eukprot:CAMPEP_0184985492 /NCGR_PEP_ID=MMETSP1098-20130426/14143_1 /TAXON_ID=89044 /ORGANISM="Spumella elongata, Strain CCAP 955/1" /LENGTH=898 /DNA_ID=CAMNT_0027509581 /DNA_START=8 /DNA_END=2704 /DNA_ORIENTATION=-
MVKLLFCGDVNGNWKQLLSRLDDLQKSQHGPFDILFLTGKVFVSEDEAKNLGSNVELPLKTYCFDCPSYIAGCSLPANLEVIGSGFNYGIVSLQHNLTVGFQGNRLGAGNDTDSGFENIRSITNGVGYRGCDICITSDWPREMHHFLEETDMKEFRATNIGIGSGSRSAASFAMAVKPRYHFVSGVGCFYQRTPYKIPLPADMSLLPTGSNTSTRLLAIDQVSASKEKSKKWLHALSIRPIIHLSAAELAEIPAGSTDCPYVDIGTPSGLVTAAGNKNPFVSGATAIADLQSAKRVRLDAKGNFAPPLPPGPPPAAATAAASGSFFFGSMGVPRNPNGGPAGPAGVNLVPPSATATTLFIGGLLRSMTDMDLESLLQGVKYVKRPAGKAFAFVEFVSHEAARNCVESAARRGLSIQGRTLTVGWGKEREPQDRNQNAGAGDENTVIERQLIPPSEDAKTLFVAGLGHFDPTAEVVEPSSGLSAIHSALGKLFPGVVSVDQPKGKSYAFVEFESYEAAMAVVTQSINEPRVMVLQNTPLIIGWAKGDHGTGPGADRLLLEPPSATSKVLFIGNLPASATDEQLTALFAECGAISVKRPEGRDYAFLEFANTQEAQKAMKLGELTLDEHVLLVGWAKGRAAERSNQSAECWFCLASPVVKVHLIVSVGEHSYLGLPRGGLTPQHVLIAPIECVPSRVHLSAAARAEMVRFQDSVESMFQAQGCVSLRFERALRTKGSRDHMQAHMIPLSLSAVQLAKSFTAFLQKASAAKLKFHEVQDDQAIDEVVVSMEGGPYQEYFYIEIPVTAGSSLNSDNSNGAAGEVEGSDSNNRVEKGKHRRFVYVQEESATKFPMQFGLEVAAEILGQPERGHWKNCLLPEAEEASLCDDFRAAFAPFDFTLG